ncbi:unnamed protein product [Closterium sp. NIES-64]|nr:unnamed protein product [Closterium sp. NIES-64]
MVVNVWPFLEANSRAWEVLTRGGSALDAVVEGCNVCEVLQCDGSVGYGGSPDEKGETTLDAMVMDGVRRDDVMVMHGVRWDDVMLSMDGGQWLACDSMDVGAVAGLRRVKAAVRVAYLVLLHTYHSLLVGDAATDFALEMGLPGPENLSTNRSLAMWRQWKAASCQPNYWRNVTPDAARSCGPYRPAPEASASEPRGGETAVPQGAEAGAAPGAGPATGPPTGPGAGPGGAGPATGRGGVSVGCDPSLVGRQQGSSRRRNRLASHDTISMVAIAQAGWGTWQGKAVVVAGRQQGSLRSTRRMASHDTISMVAIAQNGSMAAATSTNGLTFHIPGRVGDAPIAGAGAYVDSRVGGCGATGDGDVMMRFLAVELMRMCYTPASSLSSHLPSSLPPLPHSSSLHYFSFLAVELMRMGSSPASAAEAAISRIRAKFPTFVGGLVAVNSILGNSKETLLAKLQFFVELVGKETAGRLATWDDHIHSEELLIRGLLFTALQERLGRMVAAMLSAALFALFHLSLSLLFPNMALGIAAGLLAGANGLWLCWRQEGCFDES